MSGLGRIGKLRAKGCKKALEYYNEHHRPEWSNWSIRDQVSGELVDPKTLTPAHKIGRPHIKAGMSLGEGEHPDNIWATQWKYHRVVDSNPQMKKALMRQKVSCFQGGVLVLTHIQKLTLGVK